MGLKEYQSLLKSLHFPPEIKVEDSEIQKLDEKNLPIYTILCPLYKEEKILPSPFAPSTTLVK